MKRTSGASNSLCVCAKNGQILVLGEWYVNHSWMAQCRFAVPSTHMRIWLVNHSQAICESFGTLVYTRLYTTDHMLKMTHAKVSLVRNSVHDSVKPLFHNFSTEAFCADCCNYPEHMCKISPG